MPQGPPKNVGLQHYSEEKAGEMYTETPVPLTNMSCHNEREVGLANYLVQINFE